ncbi:MAG: hypothetical protein HG450_004050 [Clostridiales bacterium]|nr:hypothetical protein [Clostridiales bacterium]
MEKKELSRKDWIIEYLENSIDDNAGFNLEWELKKDNKTFITSVTKITPSMLQDTLKFVLNELDEDLNYIGNDEIGAGFTARIKVWQMFDVEEW